MLVNFDKILVDAYGDEFTQPKMNPETHKEEDVPVKISTPVADALYMTIDSDKDLDGKASLALHSLAQRVIEGGPREYSIEELVDIKNRVFKTKARIIYARVCECIEAGSPKEETK